MVIKLGIESHRDETKIKNEFRDKILELIEDYGFEEFIFVGNNDKFKEGGMSMTRVYRDAKKDAIKLLRNTLEQWELENGGDPDEDWSKDND